MDESANMWRRQFRADEIFYIESAMAVETPGRDQEERLPFVISPDCWPLVSLCATGTRVDVGPGGYKPREDLEMMIMTWKDLARLQASIDEVVRAWPEDRAAAYNACRDQAAMAYRNAQGDMK